MPLNKQNKPIIRKQTKKQKTQLHSQKHNEKKRELQRKYDTDLLKLRQLNKNKTKAILNDILK